MASPNPQFTGLPMPVFAAFGWAGEEAALNYALEQLQLFVDVLYHRVPREIRALFPHFGLDRESHSVYLSTAEGEESDMYLAFYARPMNLQILLNIVSGELLDKAVKSAEKEPEGWYRLLMSLGPDWSLRVQQMEVNEDSGERALSKDLFKDDIGTLTQEQATELAGRMAYLNSEGKWATPIFLGKRLPSEQVAVMGTSVIDVINEQLQLLIPVLEFMTGQLRRQATRARATRAAAPAQVEEEMPETIRPQGPDAVDEFTFDTELMPLHIRRGFVNLTPEHWPFFAANARMTVRPITLRYSDRTDSKSSVWRLKPNDQARIVLSEKVQSWLEDNFYAHDQIRVRAFKLEDDKIEVILEHA